jgi:hypothetical protein
MKHEVHYRHPFILSDITPVHDILPYVINNNFNIILPSRHRYSDWYISFRLFKQFLRISNQPKSIIYPALFIALFDQHNNKMGDEGVEMRAV